MWKLLGYDEDRLFFFVDIILGISIVVLSLLYIFLLKIYWIYNLFVYIEKGDFGGFSFLILVSVLKK